MSGDRLREALQLITHIDAGDEQAGWECVRIAREALVADERGGGAGLDARLALARLERFIDFGYDTGTAPRPMFVTANGIRQDMPRRFLDDARALRDQLLAAAQPASHAAEGERPITSAIEQDAGVCPTCGDWACIGRLSYENCRTAPLVVRP